MPKAKAEKKAAASKAGDTLRITQGGDAPVLTLNGERLTGVTAFKIVQRIGGLATAVIELERVAVETEITLPVEQTSAP